MYAEIVALYHKYWINLSNIIFYLYLKIYFNKFIQKLKVYFKLL
jgi:hypothetical protein